MTVQLGQSRDSWDKTMMGQPGQDIYVRQNIEDKTDRRGQSGESNR
jgi:hypothetical protein